MKLYKAVKHKGNSKLNYIKNIPYVLNSKALNKSVNPNCVLQKIWKEGVEIKINKDI